MTIWSRLGDAMNGAIEGWKRGNTPMYVNREDWDSYETRLRRYELNELYYSNQQYDILNRYITRMRMAGRLYTNVRSVYNPVYRLTNVYADKVYPGTIDFANMVDGAVPINGDDKLRTAISRLFRWSNWNAEKQLYVRVGEKLGDVYIRVVDDVESKRVLLEVVDPQKIEYMRKDSAGNIKEIWITYRERINENPKPGISITDLSLTREVTERITGETIEIYHDKKLVDSWANPFGFVYVTHMKPVDEGNMFGATHWNGPIPKIDEINSQAALLNDQVRKSIIPYIVTIGAELEQGSLTRSAATMDEIINIGMPEGGDAKALVPTVDIASALNNIHSQLDELREDIPELFLYQLTGMTVAPSGVSLRQFFDLAVSKIQSAQGLYDDALIKAIQMAITVGGIQRYKDFEPFNKNSFDRGDLDFSIKPREVIYDALTRDQRVKYLLASGAPQDAIWVELGVGQEDRDQWRTDLETQNEEAIQRSIDNQANPGGDINAPNIQVNNGQSN